MSRPTETIVVPVRAPVEPHRLCERVAQHLRAGHGVICEVPGPVDLSTVDALAQLQLLAKRLGGWLRVRSNGGDLMRLLDLTGMRSAVPDLLLEVGGQPEAGEQRGVEEVVDVSDPAG